MAGLTVTLAAHLSNALDSYARQLRRDGRAVPPELAVLLAAFSATSRHEPTEFGADATAGESGRMAHLLDLDEVALALRVSGRSAERLIASGDLPSVTIGRSRRVRGADLEQYIEQLPVSTREDKQND
jgi:excisionase family DNA binding protein